jgi:sugar phosphate isomerase/epimerase
LRFGIEQMQPSLLIKQVRHIMATSEHPVAGSLDVDVAAQVAQLADLGFRLIELNPDLAIFFPRSYDLATIRRLGALKEQRQLSYTVHLPLWSIEPSTPVQAVRQGSVDTLVDAVLRLAPLEPEVYVMHATGPLAAEFTRMKAVEPMRPLVLGLFAAQAQRSIEELLERTGVAARLLAIETVEFPFDLTLQLAEDLDLSMCLDTGHILAGYTSGISLLDALQRTLPRLAEIHLHDGYRHELPGGAVSVDDHLPLGAGDLPLGDFLDGVVESGFSGPTILELSLEGARASLETVGTLRPGLLE